MSDIGTSTLYSTEWVIDRLRALKPRSIIDIGCGWGRWGFLAREFLELWEHRFRKEDWAIRIDALDIHLGTWTPIHSYVYDHCYTGDVRRWAPVQRYDVAVACDVLEHMPKDDGMNVLTRFRSQGSSVLVGVPLGDAWPLRPGFDGNPHEAHVSRWYAGDFPGAIESRETMTEDGLPYGLFQL